MLIRLLKYDFKKMFGFLSIFFLMALFFGFLTRFFGELEASLAFSICKGICNGTMISMLCSLLINCFMRTWVLFRASLFGDESYLTHTLPVKRETIYAAKALNAAICIFLSLIAIIAVLFITYWSEDLELLLKAFLVPITDYLGISAWGLFIFLFALLFVEFFNGVQIGMMGILIGHRFLQKKILLSVIFGFAVYMVTQSVTLLGMLLIGLIDSDFMKIFSTNDLMSLKPETIITVSLVGFAFYALISIAGFIVNSYILKKGVNVE